MTQVHFTLKQEEIQNLRLCQVVSGIKFAPKAKLSKNALK